MPPKEISGFFYDEEKDRYFPNHMKAIYDKNKEAKEKAERKLEEAQDTSTYLYKFIRNSSIRFDPLAERLARINVYEINWPHQIQIDAEKGSYHRYRWEGGEYSIQQVKVESDQILNEFRYECSDPLLDFKVFEDVAVTVRLNENTSTEIYCFVKGKSDSTVDIENNLYISTAGFHITDTVTIGSHGYNIAYNKNNKLLSYVIPNGRGQYKTITYNNSLEPVIKVFDKFEFFCEQHGINTDDLKSVNNIHSKLKELTKSSAKWIHFSSEHDLYLILTYHGTLYSIKAKNEEIVELFQVKDIIEGEFDDLVVECQGRVILFGFRNGKEIIALDWSNPRKILKRFILSKPLEQFKISADFIRIILHFKS